MPSIQILYYDNILFLPLCEGGEVLKFAFLLYFQSSYRFFSSLFRIRNCLAQLYAKDITPDDKQELDEALQREVTISIL